MSAADMELDPSNPVVALCAAGVAVGGDPVAAAACFARAWDARRDDFDAAVAAHYVARHQATPAERLASDLRAATHAEAALAALPDDGYRAFVGRGVARLQRRAEAGPGMRPSDAALQGSSNGALHSPSESARS